MALPAPATGSTCLVTGASSGIGVELARQLAAKGHGVTLVARREDKLIELAGQLEREHGVRAEVAACDLSDAAERDALVGTLAERGLRVEALLNNAGFGSAGPFQRLERDWELRMVRTNVEAVVDLCARYVPEMVERGRGAILNVASTAAFQPLPRQSTYSASKAFVLAFSEAIASDLKGTGVTVTALCPGPVRTEFTDAHEGFGAADSTPDFVWMTAEDTARAAVKGMERGKRVVVPGVGNRLGAIAGQHAPRSLLLAAARRFYPLGR
jgi:short-subunit dehydrogenase